MRVFLWLCGVGLCVTLFLFLVAYAFLPTHNSNGYISPLPRLLSLADNKQATLLDFWLPFIGIQKTEGSEKIAPPVHTAKSVLIYDLTTEQTLYEYDAKKRLPMASLTKIMTAIVALENKKPNDSYRVSGENLVGEDSMGLEAGETLNLQELLYGLMLPSGNDAAEVLASNYPEGRAAFLQAMNNKVIALGLKDTKFSNPSGLQGDGIQYTTTYDLLVMTKYALDNFPELGKIVATYEYLIPATSTHREYLLYNETNLLTSYPGVKGLKTGYTPEAGMCLVTYFEYGDHKIVGIILNSENRREEMKQFLDYSLLKLGIEPPAHQ